MPSQPISPLRRALAAFDRKLTRDAISIWLAGVEAVQSDHVVESQIDWDGKWLSIADHTWDLSQVNRLIVVGAGKATSGMLTGLRKAFSRSKDRVPPLSGWINIPEGVQHNTEFVQDDINVCEARPLGCNEPTDRVVAGTRRILEFVESSGPNDCVIALISGGGSALLCLPIDGISLEVKTQLTRDLASTGANIEQLNAVRRCLSQVKGGSLARACKAKMLITCVLSDVLGDPLEFIASGPTILEPFPDPRQAMEVMDKFLPRQYTLVRQLLNKQMHISESAFPEGSVQRPNREVIVLANNATAVDASGKKAVEMGYRYWMKSERRCEGEAEEVGRKLAVQMIASCEDSQIDCIITGGEPTVRLPPQHLRGLGGRNQQLALAALDEWNRRGFHQADFALVAGGTDGEDGPTDAAGAFVDPAIRIQALQMGLEPNDFLSRCDAYHFFERAGGLLKTGPTNTNVCDLRVALVRRLDAESRS
ncbi:MAG: DUF4147 domain-containing protein [Pirellula sp.]